MPKRSAGLLVYRTRGDGELEVLLVHPGGPIWASHDEGAWSIPKGEYAPSEDPLDAALREFTEELGRDVPSGSRLELGQIKQASGKRVTAWAVRGDVEVTTIESNLFEMEWPPHSGTMSSFPEVDRAAWFDVPTAQDKLVKAQVPFIERLVDVLRIG